MVGMYRHSEKLLRRFLHGLDLILASAAFLAAYNLRSWLDQAEQLPSALMWAASHLPAFYDEGTYGLLFVLTIAIMGGSLYFSGAHNFRCSYRTLAKRYARAVGGGMVALIAAIFVFKLGVIARSFVFMFAVMAYAFLLLGRVLCMELLAVVRQKRVDGHRVVVVGTTAKAVRCAEAIKADDAWDLMVTGFVEMAGERSVAEASPRLGTLEGLSELLDRDPVDEVLFAGMDMGASVPEAALRACHDRGIDITLPLPPTLPNAGTLNVGMVEGYDRPLLSLRSTLDGTFTMLVKRGIDIVGASVMLLLAAPVMLTTALAIRITSPGAALFHQVRSSRHGRRFRMYKFRSMVADAEAQRAGLQSQNEVEGPVFKIERDPRITRVGRFIRRTSIDELPQLLNVLSGDMSLVGPRPPLPSEVEQYESWHRRRLAVKPGLTGLWQVSGRNRIGFTERVELDLRYIDQWSLWLDLKILVRTVPVVLLGTGS